MALPTGFRPRSEAERLQLAEALQQAPLRVGLGLVDDGWAAAHLWLWGRIPVWQGLGSREGIDGVLAGLGLPPLADGPADGVLEEGCLLRSEAAPASAPLPAPGGDAPLVTVLVCTYNRADLLPEALASVDMQSWPHELLVVDDGSEDGTWDLLAQRSNLRALRQPDNQGKPSALNRGISEARGEYLLILDDDDLIVPGALTLLATALQRNPELDLVWGDALVVEHPAMSPKFWRPALRLPAQLNRLGVLQQIPATTGAVLVRTDALRAAGPFVEGMHQGEDMDMFLRLARGGQAEGLPLATFVLRSHPGVRGPATHSFFKESSSHATQIGMQWITPIFRERWEEARAAAGREESHAWALGLELRDSRDQALEELGRWDGPYTPREAWIREKIGLKPGASPRPEQAVVVVDDGDPGALEATLAQHAGAGELWVDLEVPREPLDSVRLYWPGHYAVQQDLLSWVEHDGPWLLRFSADPDWTPPALEVPDRRFLASLPGVDALFVLAAALDWPLPSSTRGRLARPTHPLSPVAVRSRLAIRDGRAAEALGLLATPLEQSPEVLGLWRLAADAFRALGVEAEALACEAKLG